MGSSKELISTRLQKKETGALVCLRTCMSLSKEMIADCCLEYQHLLEGVVEAACGKNGGADSGVELAEGKITNHVCFLFFLETIL